MFLLLNLNEVFLIFYLTDKIKSIHISGKSIKRNVVILIIFFFLKHHVSL